MILICPVSNFKVNYETKKCELKIWNNPILKHLISEKVRGLLECFIRTFSYCLR